MSGSKIYNAELYGKESILLAYSKRSGLHSNIKGKPWTLKRSENMLLDMGEDKKGDWDSIMDMEFIYFKFFSCDLDSAIYYISQHGLEKLEFGTELFRLGQLLISKSHCKTLKLPS